MKSIYERLAKVEWKTYDNHQAQGANKFSHSIVESQIFTFVVGLRKKEYKIHEAAFSSLSRPLRVLLNGPHKEAQDLRVEWPDVDEQTFVRFTQWAYTKNYVTEEPEIILNQLHLQEVEPSDDGDDLEKNFPSPDAPEQAMYSLQSLLGYRGIADRGHCGNPLCNYFGSAFPAGTLRSVQCLACRSNYQTKVCASCGSAWSDCNKCVLSKGTDRSRCSKPDCPYGKGRQGGYSTTTSLQCSICKNDFQARCCDCCDSAYTDCPICYETGLSCSPARRGLIDEFMDRDGTNYPAITLLFEPKKNTDGYEDYTRVFLCHAKLYVLGDTYDIPELQQLALHRLHATLKQFTLYPSRLNDIAALTKYIFDNTRTPDKIQDMISHYYACIVEDALKHDGLESLVEEIPDFAFSLISRMCERLH